MSDFKFTTELDLSQAQRQVNDFAKNVPNIRLRFDNQPLGRINGQISEFQKSLSASNARVLAFSASAGAMYAIVRAFDSIVKSTINVQKSLTDINVVFNLSQRQLDGFSSSLFKVANETGQSFKDVAEAALQFSRQGLNIEQTLTRTRSAMTLTRLTGLQLEDSIKAITTTLNAFNDVTIDSNKIIEKLSAVDTKFAISGRDLAESLTRIGSIARDVGLDLNKTLGLVTSARVITGREGSVIATALGTILQRVQRPQVLEQLERLGVVTRSYSGEVLSADKILQNLAKTYDTLSNSEKVQVSQLTSGIRSANVFKALLSDLSKENSIYSRATLAAANASDSATRRQLELNKTLSAQINETVNNFTEASSKIGNLTIAPALKNVLGFGNLISSSINKDLSSEGEEAGKFFGEGVFKGIGNYLSGPGLALGGIILGRFFLNFIEFASKSLSQLVEVGSARLEKETAIENILAREPALLNELVALEGNQLAIQQRVTQELEKQLTLQNARATVSNIIYSQTANQFSAERAFAVNQRGELGINTSKVPNFASPLASALLREQGAGVPSSLIRVGHSTSLKSSSNPIGLGVYNLRDEPGGLPQGIGRAITEGKSPTNYGIPNFAGPDLPYPFNLLPSSLTSQLPQAQVFNQSSLAPDSVKYGKIPENYGYPSPFPKLLQQGNFKNPIALPEFSPSTQQENLYKQQYGPFPLPFKQSPNLLTQGTYKNPINLPEFSDSTKRGILGEKSLDLGFTDDLKNSFKNLGKSANELSPQFKNLIDELNSRLKSGPKRAIGQEQGELFPSFNKNKEILSGTQTELDLFKSTPPPLGPPRPNSEQFDALRLQRGQELFSQLGVSDSLFPFTQKYRAATSYAKDNNLPNLTKQFQSTSANRAFLASIGAPIVGGIAEQGINNAYGETATGRGVARAAGGLGNVASYAFTGLGLSGGNPLGFAAGAGAGLLLELPSIIKSFNDTLPDLERNLNKLKETAEKNSAAIGGFIDSSEKLAAVYSGEINGVTNGEISKLKREQFTNLAAIPNSDDRKRIRELIGGGNITGARELQSNIQVKDEQSVRAVQLQEQVLKFLDKFQTDSQINSKFGGIRSSAGYGALPIQAVGADYTKIEEELNNPERQKQIGQFSSDAISQLFNLTNTKGQSAFDVLTKPENINRIGSTTPSNRLAAIKDIDAGKNYLDVLKEILTEGNINPDGLERILSVLKKLSEASPQFAETISGELKPDKLQAAVDASKLFETTTKQNIKTLDDFVRKLKDSQKNFDDFGDIIEEQSVRSLAISSSGRKVEQIETQSQNKLQLSRSGGNPFLANKFTLEEQLQGSDTELKDKLEKGSNDALSGTFDILSNFRKDLVDKLVKDLPKNLEPNQLKKQTTGIQNTVALTFDFDKDLEDIKLKVLSGKQLTKEDADNIQESVKDRLSFFGKLGGVEPLFISQFRNDAGKLNLSAPEFAKTPQGTQILKQQGLADKSGKLNDVGEFLVNSPLDDGTLSTIARSSKFQVEAADKTTDELDKLFNTYEKLTISAGAEAYSRERIANALSEYQKKLIAPTISLSSDQQKILGATNEFAAREGKGKDIDFGGTLASGFQYNNKQFFADLSKNTQDFGKEFKDAFTSSFAEAENSSKKFTDILRDNFLKLAQNITTKFIGQGLDVLFGSTIGKLAPTFSEAFGGQSKANGGLISKFSNGGFVGMGSGTKDDVPAMLSGGEYVINKSAVNSIGKNNLDMMNGAKGYADGAFVQPNVYLYKYSQNTRNPEYAGATLKDSTNLGNNSANIDLANAYLLKGKKGSFDTSPLLSSYALTDENNPQNKLKFSREQKIFNIAQANRKISSERSQFNTNQDITLAASLVSAGIHTAGAFKSSSIQDPSATYDFQHGQGPVSNDFALSSPNSEYLQNNNNFNDLINSGGVSPIIFNSSIGQAKGGYIRKMAMGGVFGGDTRGDSSPAMLMGGEYVMKPSVVSKYGVNYFNNLNSKKYSLGGYTGGSSSGNNDSQNIVLDSFTKLIAISEDISNKLGNNNINNLSVSKNANSNQNQNNTSASNNGITNNITVNVTVESASNGTPTATTTNNQSTSNSSNQGDADNAKKLGTAVVGAVRNEIINQSKNGGLIWEKFVPRSR